MLEGRVRPRQHASPGEQRRDERDGGEHEPRRGTGAVWPGVVHLDLRRQRMMSEVEGPHRRLQFATRRRVTVVVTERGIGRGP